MKTLYKFLVPALLSVMVISCKDMNDLHEIYLEEGEVIYTKKVDSLMTYPGNGRMMVWGILEKAYNIDEVVVAWNDGENTQVFPYEKSTEEADTLELMIPDLEEGNYELQVYSRDGDGNQSIPVTLFGTVYGDIYRSTLTPRAVTGFNYDAADAHLYFEASNTFQRKTEVKYTNESGSEAIEVLSGQKDTLTLPEYALETDILYRTYYVPRAANENGMETVVDEFDSEWKTLALPDILPVLESMSFTGILGGIDVAWDNPEELSLKLDFVYFVNGEEKTVTVESNEVAGEATVSAMQGAAQEITVRVSDLFNFSFSRVYTVTPVEAVLIDKTGWTVTDFSSEEPAEGPPKGLASATIDNDLGTFWHTAYADEQPGFPHWFIVDMGEEKTISSFEAFRRQGDARGQIKHKFSVSDDGVTWTDMGTFNMDPNINDGQIYATPSNPTARYFKYEALEGPNFFAALAEINIYGLE